MLGFGLGEGAKFAGALVNGVRGDLSGEICSFGSGARRKRKNVKVAERESGDEIHRGGMIFTGFTGEADDDIGADGGMWKRFANEFDAASIVRGAIPTMHGAKNAVGAGLQRQMEVWRDARFGGDEIDEVLSDVDG